MFRIKIIRKLIIELANFLISNVFKVYLLLFGSIFISFFAKIYFLQIINIKFGKRVAICSGCILDINGDSKLIIGDDVLIQENTYLLSYCGKGISIGKNTNINKDCILYGHGGLNIGDNCLIAAKCIFIPANHNFKNNEVNINKQGETRKGIFIGDNVWIGAGVIVLDGVSIGSNSIIGAGALVVKSIPPDSIAVGVPAKVIKKRF